MDAETPLAQTHDFEVCRLVTQQVSFAYAHTKDLSDLLGCIGSLSIVAAIGF